MPTYTGQLGTLLTITVPSVLLGCRWSQNQAVVGGEVVLVIHTGYVGDGGPVDFRILDENGSTVAKLKGIVHQNIGSAKWIVPAKAKGNLLFIAEAKDVELVGRSDTLRVVTGAAIGPASVTDPDGKSLSQVQIGDRVRWICKLPGVPDDTPFQWRIQCHQDAAHQTTVATGRGFAKQGRGEIVWKSSYPFEQAGKKSQKELDPTSETYQDAFYQAHFSCLGVTARSWEVKIKTGLTIEYLSESSGSRTVELPDSPQHKIDAGPDILSGPEKPAVGGSFVDASKTTDLGDLAG
jgi:hypothetical protein